MTGWQSLGLALAVSVPIGAFADQSPETALRGLPVVALVALVDAVRRAWDDAADVVLWAFVVGALLRLPLSAGAYHYGFYLLPIPLAALLLLWFRRLPPLIADSPRGATFCAATAATLVATLGATHLPASAAFYRQHTAHVRTARGDLWLLDGVGGIPIGRFYAEAVARLATFPPETTVFAAPEGAGLAFLAGRPSRQEVMAEANVQANRLIDEARAAASRVQQEETRKAVAAAEQIVARAREAAAQDHARMLAELRREVGRLVVQTTAAVTGKVLTTEDQRRLAEETARSLSA